MNYNFIRAGRALLNWTQAELAVKACVSLSALQTFEAGNASTSAANIAAIQRALEDGGAIFRADGGLDSADAVLDRYSKLD